MSGCTCVGVGLRAKLATLTGQTEHSEECQKRTTNGAVLTREEGQNHNENVMVLTLGVTEATEVSGPATSVNSLTLNEGP